jgi:hypothetical protein
MVFVAILFGSGLEFKPASKAEGRVSFVWWCREVGRAGSGSVGVSRDDVSVALATSVFELGQVGTHKSQITQLQVQSQSKPVHQPSRALLHVRGSCVAFTCQKLVVCMSTTLIALLLSFLCPPLCDRPRRRPTC